jgi:hypothetical protein
MIQKIHHIDSLLARAEKRRDQSLFEIDRRRAVLGEALRGELREVEARSVAAIEGGSATGKNAA